SGRKLLNLYGSSEVTADVTWSEESGEGEGGVKIGRPIDNTQVYLLDGRVQPVAKGVKGELYVSGAGLARGYLGKAGGTAERFIANPYSEEGGGRMYKTGDEGRYDEEGRLEYVGRVDQQVKVRGQRVELGEIERVLEQHGGVKQAVVVARAERDGQPRVTAYVVGKEEEVKRKELRYSLF